MASRKARRSAFVPRVLVPTAIASVVPACALSHANREPPAADGGITAASVAAIGFGVGVAAFGPDSGMPVATLCGDPVCPPLPGEDASTDDVEAGPPPASDAASDASTDGSSSDSGGEGGSRELEAASD